MSKQNQKNKSVLAEAKNNAGGKSRADKSAAIIVEIDAAIGTFQEWREGFQEVCMKAALFTMTEEGDVTPTQHLVNKMSDKLLQGIDGRSLLAWFEEYGQCHINEGVDGAKPHVKFNKKGRTDIDAPKGMKATKWWMCKPQKMFEGFSLHDELNKLISKTSKMKQKGGDDAALVEVEESELAVLRIVGLGKAELLLDLLSKHDSALALKNNAA